ncbi:hypothetical protein KDC22_08970 [Paenibacillus tritici]|uniref:hypothetical protein n=1 Tax=Paenibacillus tritici TaxID=1873425 RepID=UPI001BAC36A2|nr:hypothetical protein [Paenibacillus tritici]QUL56597.1 hypothetical protein KDC22_08970 [Paenibacillus tritici]
MDEEKNTHEEFLWLKAEKRALSLQNIRWFEEMLTFDTLREAEEWVMSDAYNRLGEGEYDGYRTSDPKLAFALVYNLTRLKTLGGASFNTIYADEEVRDGHIVFRVWVN